MDQLPKVGECVYRYHRPDHALYGVIVETNYHMKGFYPRCRVMWNISGAKTWVMATALSVLQPDKARKVQWEGKALLFLQKGGIPSVNLGI